MRLKEGVRYELRLFNFCYESLKSLAVQTQILGSKIKIATGAAVAALLTLAALPLPGLIPNLQPSSEIYNE